jgi:hypothetical protein
MQINPAQLPSVQTAGRERLRIAHGCKAIRADAPRFVLEQA